MKKILILSAFAAAAISLVAADNVETGNGVVKQMDTVRYNIANVGANSPTLSDTRTAITNVVSSRAAIIGKVVFVPEALNDAISIYDASSSASANSTNLVFNTKAASPTLGFAALPLGAAQEFAINAATTNGIVVIRTRSASSTAAPSYLMWDRRR